MRAMIFEAPGQPLVLRDVPVPEPGAVGLLVVAAASVAVRRRRPAKSR